MRSGDVCDCPSRRARSGGAPKYGELDPSAPLAPLPDIGVDWPDLNAREQLPSTEQAPVPQPATTALADENGGDFAIGWTIEGLAGIGNVEELLKAFRQQSALDADRKNPANAAQIGRRSSADADLLAQLLRSQGYYDAAVEPRTERADGTTSSGPRR